MSSKPMTERSRGTPSPSSAATFTISIAEMSFAAKMAVGRFAAAEHLERRTRTAS